MAIYFSSSSMNFGVQQNSEFDSSATATTDDRRPIEPRRVSADSSPATEKIVWGLSLKIFQNDTIDIEDSVGVQNRQAGCLPVVVSGLPSRAASGKEPSNSPSTSGGP